MVFLWLAGVDGCMNLVLEDAEEVNIKKKSRKSLGNYILNFPTLLLFMHEDSF
jgi:small nuclear ribonucleoprotein E